MIYLFAGITGIILIISFIKDRKKTLSGLKIAVKKAVKIIIPLVIVLIFVSLVLFFIPGDVISTQLSDKNKYLRFNEIEYNSYYLFKAFQILGEKIKFFQHKTLKLLFLKNSKFATLICPKF